MRFHDNNCQQICLGSTLRFHICIYTWLLLCMYVYIILHISMYISSHVQLHSGCMIALTYWCICFVGYLRFDRTISISLWTHVSLPSSYTAKGRLGRFNILTYISLSLSVPLFSLFIYMYVYMHVHVSIYGLCKDAAMIPWRSCLCVFSPCLCLLNSQQILKSTRIGTTVIGPSVANFWTFMQNITSIETLEDLTWKILPGPMNPVTRSRQPDWRKIIFSRSLERKCW